MVQITLTENQLKIINHALETHFRLCMGQAWDFADEICEQNLGRERDGKYYMYREFVRKIMESLIKDIALGSNFDRLRKTPEVQAEIDMWNAIRHWKWKQLPENERGEGTDSCAPMQFGPEPLPLIERVDTKR